MTIDDRLDARWADEVNEVRERAARSSGKLEVPQHNLQRVELHLRIMSAVAGGGAGPTVQEATHIVHLMRPAAWPAQGVVAAHRGVVGNPNLMAWHPNILAPATARAPGDQNPISAMQGLVGLLVPGAICYGQAGPGTRLVHVVQQIWNMLGYRYSFSAFSRTGAHLNIQATRWVQDMLRQDAFPLERRPLVKPDAGGNHVG